MSSKEEVSWYQNLPTIQQNLLEKLFAIEISKINVKMNKSVYLGLPILDIARELCTRIGMTMWNENYEKKAELCYTMGNQKIYMHVLLEMLRKRFDTSNYEVKWPLPLEKQKKKKEKKKTIELITDVLVWKIMRSKIRRDWRCAVISQIMNVLIRKHKTHWNVLSNKKSKSRTTKSVWEIFRRC